jgi:hypothetical protein
MEVGDLPRIGNALLSLRLSSSSVQRSLWHCVAGKRSSDQHETCGEHM